MNTSLDSPLRPAQRLPVAVSGECRAGSAPAEAGGHAAFELARVNGVVAASLGSWDLPARVRRLAMPSLLYDAADLEQMSVVLLEDREGDVAVAAWEAAAGRDGVPGARSVLLHGLYVVPRAQRRGLGSSLLELAASWMLARGFDAVTLRAWRESEGFFCRRGFAPLLGRGDTDAYPRRVWKPLA